MLPSTELATSRKAAIRKGDMEGETEGAEPSAAWLIQGWMIARLVQSRGVCSGAPGLAHLQDDVELGLRHWRNRQAGLLDQRHPFELRVGLDGRQRHRLVQRPDRLEVDGAPVLVRRRVLVGLAVDA